MSRKKDIRINDDGSKRPFIFVLDGITPHPAYLISEDGDYCKIIWESNKQEEIVHSNRVTKDIGGRRRLSTARYTPPESPAKKKGGQTNDINGKLASGKLPVNKESFADKKSLNDEESSISTLEKNIDVSSPKEQQNSSIQTPTNSSADESSANEKSSDEESSFDESPVQKKSVLETLENIVDVCSTDESREDFNLQSSSKLPAEIESSADEKSTPNSVTSYESIIKLPIPGRISARKAAYCPLPSVLPPPFKRKTPQLSIEEQNKPKKSPKVVSTIGMSLRRAPRTPKSISTFSIKISTAPTEWLSKKAYVEAESELLPYLTRNGHSILSNKMGQFRENILRSNDFSSLELMFLAINKLSHSDGLDIEDCLFEDEDYENSAIRDIYLRWLPEALRIIKSKRIHSWNHKQKKCVHDEYRTEELLVEEIIILIPQIWYIHSKTKLEILGKSYGIELLDSIEKVKSLAGHYKIKSIFFVCKQVMKYLNAIKCGISLPKVERIDRRKLNKTFIEYDLIRKLDTTPTHFYKRHSTPKNQEIVEVHDSSSTEGTNYCSAEEELIRDDSTNQEIIKVNDSSFNEDINYYSAEESIKDDSNVTPNAKEHSQQLSNECSQNENGSIGKKQLPKKTHVQNIEEEAGALTDKIVNRNSSRLNQPNTDYDGFQYIS